MRREGQTFILLDGRTSSCGEGSDRWCTASLSNVSASAGGLRLVADARGPLALTAEDESLGGVILPRGMALDGENTLYLLRKSAPFVRRFDTGRRAFAPPLSTGTADAEEGSDGGQFRDPSNIAVAGHNLYVADRGNRRVQVFALGTRALRHLWGPWDGEGCRVKPDDPAAWEPVDVASQGGFAFILDARYGRVYRHRPGTDTLKLVVEGRGAEGRWSRVALDREGLVYVLDEGAGVVEVYDTSGRHVETHKDAGDIRERFDPPPVRLYREGESWRFCMPESLMRECDRRPPDMPPALESPQGSCRARPRGGSLVFDREGERVSETGEITAGPRLYETRGEWVSRPLDSDIYRCQWHRVEMELGQLPPGTRVEVSTHADARKLTDEDVGGLSEGNWQAGIRLDGRLLPPGAARGGAAPPPPRHEFLVQSREGQYLWLRVRLYGDGFATPSVKSLRVHYPRESYLGYLPAFYSSDEESRWFLERFLSIFQTEWDELERKIEDVAALFDPRAVPAGRALEYLASWFALPMEGTWDGERKRRLLEAVSGIYFGRRKVTGERDECLAEVEPEKAARRGTREGLRSFLQVYLQNMTGLAPAEQGAYPQIVEGFRERQRLMLSGGDTCALGSGAPLWSASAVGRLRPDSFGREGEVRLVSTGDPERDIFHEFAHRFRVFVPSAWVRTGSEEQMVRRALNAEKPAHASFDLCLVEPRFRVGLQSTVGVDTILGGSPAARLACRHETDVPESRPPHSRLGYDMVLTAPPGDRATLRVGAGTRVGLDTLLN